jgi:ferredoxin, 2Fe-2S
MSATENAVMEPATEKKVYNVTFIKPNGETVIIGYEPDNTPYLEHGKEGSILDIALNNHVELQHACGGNCACTTCHIIVKQGEENLSEMEEDEEDRIYMADSVTLRSRLGCQAIVKGDVTVEIVE